jgi:hypothetical protein
MTSMTAGSTYHARVSAAKPRWHVGVHVWIMLALLAAAVVICAVPASIYVSGRLVEAPYVGL